MKNRVAGIAIVFLLAFLGIAGCESPSEAPEGGLEQAQAPEQWNSTNSPTVFSTTLEYKLSELPKEGEAAKLPWPDTYWPTYEDSYNVRWQVIYKYKPVSKDTLSPAEKYDMAFNNWKPSDDFYKLKPYSESNCADKSWDKAYYDQLGPAAKYVAQNKGNWDAHNGVDDDGDGKTDECDDRDGVETWWGLCHAWVPAALLEAEPEKAVEHNGVKFEVADIKALVQGAMYDRSNAVLVGGRCNDKEVKRDPKTGRILADQCRDVNPGTYHVIMANYLGKMKRGVAEDRTYDYQVWNQPIRSWKVDSMKKITLTQAIKLLGQPSTVKKWPHGTNAKTFYEVTSTTSYITESYPEDKPLLPELDTYTRTDTYHYILELDKNGKIIGGEWLDPSHTSHPDFLWLPIAPQGGNYYVDMKNLKMLLDKSHQPDVPVGDFKAYDNKTAIDIPDNKPAGITSKITVPDDFTVGAKVEVEVDITHTYIGDLKVSIKHGGKEVVLHDNAGGSAKDLKKTFSVADFAGLAAKGDWELVVADTASSDSGKLNLWKLRIAQGGGTTPTGSTIKAAASDCPKDIKDNTPAGTDSTITVNDSKTVKGTKVTVKITHSYIGSLVVKLTHGGKTRVLHNMEGESGTSIEKTYDVTDFNGGSSSGTWVLNAADTDEYDDTGKIESWSLEITY